PPISVLELNPALLRCRKSALCLRLASPATADRARSSGSSLLTGVAIEAPQFGRRPSAHAAVHRVPPKLAAPRPDRCDRFQLPVVSEDELSNAPNLPRYNAQKVSCGPIHARAQQPCYTNLVQALHSCPNHPTASPLRYATHCRPLV